MNRVQKTHFENNLAVVADKTLPSQQRIAAAQGLHRATGFLDKNGPQADMLISVLADAKTTADTSLKADLVTYLFYLSIPKPDYDTRDVLAENVQTMMDYFNTGIPSQDDKKHIAEQGLCLEANIMYSNMYGPPYSGALMSTLGTMITAASKIDHPDMAATLYETAANVISKTLEQKRHNFNSEECKTLGQTILNTFQPPKPITQEQSRLLQVTVKDFSRNEKAFQPLPMHDPALSEKVTTIYNAFSQNSPEIVSMNLTEKQRSVYRAHHQALLHLLDFC